MRLRSFTNAATVPRNSDLNPTLHVINIFTSGTEGNGTEGKVKEGSRTEGKVKEGSGRVKPSQARLRIYNIHDFCYLKFHA